MVARIMGCMTTVDRIRRHGTHRIEANTSLLISIIKNMTGITQTRGFRTNTTPTLVLLKTSNTGTSRTSTKPSESRRFMMTATNRNRAPVSTTRTACTIPRNPNPEQPGEASGPEIWPGSIARALRSIRTPEKSDITPGMDFRTRITSQRAETNHRKESQCIKASRAKCTSRSSNLTKILARRKDPKTIFSITQGKKNKES